MRVLHLFQSDENEKFSLPFIEFVKKNFDMTEHSFLIYEKKSRNIFSKYSNVKTLPKNLFSILLAIRQVNASEKIIIHGLFSSYVLYLLILNPKNIKKCNWVVWGGDLYHYLNRKRSFTENLKEKLRGYIIKNLHGFITQIRGDYELAQKWYGATGKHFYSFVYPSNCYKEYNLTEVPRDKNKTYIQIGNSACSTNNHVEVFEKLAKYKDENITIVCPLSYSGKECYIKNVILEGKRIFGDKFLPITDFMPFGEYLKLLAKVDIAIFNHNRQRGLGNITTLIGLGKKVYIREEITTWDFCIDHGLKVFSANGEFSELLERIQEDDKKRNIENVKTNFSEAKLIEDLRGIFE